MDPLLVTHFALREMLGWVRRNWEVSGLTYHGEHLVPYVVGFSPPHIPLPTLTGPFSRYISLKKVLIPGFSHDTLEDEIVCAGQVFVPFEGTADYQSFEGKEGDYIVYSEAFYTWKVMTQDEFNATYKPQT